MDHLIKEQDLIPNEVYEIRIGDENSIIAIYKNKNDRFEGIHSFTVISSSNSRFKSNDSYDLIFRYNSVLNRTIVKIS